MNVAERCLRPLQLGLLVILFRTLEIANLDGMPGSNHVDARAGLKGRFLRFELKAANPLAAHLGYWRQPADKVLTLEGPREIAPPDQPDAVDTPGFVGSGGGARLVRAPHCIAQHRRRNADDPPSRAVRGADFGFHH